MNAEKKLKTLFDYQRFERDEKLEKLIRETEGRYQTELSDDDLSFVNAAGDAAADVDHRVLTHTRLMIEKEEST